MSKNTVTKAKAASKAKRRTQVASPAEQSDTATGTQTAGEDYSGVATSAVALGSCALAYWSLPPTSQIGLFDALKVQTDALKTGDMSGVEEMLFCQAATLQGIFAKLLESAAKRDTLHQQQLLLTIAFKALAQCRATLDTLGSIKNPRAATFVKQANIANGPQQINNGEPSRTGEKLIQSNELLGIDDGKRLDTGTAGATSGTNSGLEALGAVNGAANSQG